MTFAQQKLSKEPVGSLRSAKQLSKVRNSTRGPSEFSSSCFLKRGLLITFVLCANHAVALEAAQIAVATQSEVVFRPLGIAALVDYATRHDDRLADDGRLIFGLSLEALSRP